MRRKLLELFQAFTYGIFCVSLIAVSLSFSTISETSPKPNSEATLEKVSESNSTVYSNRGKIFVSGNSALSFSYQEKNKSQMGELKNEFGYLSFNAYQSFFSFEIKERLKFTNILEQLHNIDFFF